MTSAAGARSDEADKPLYRFAVASDIHFEQKGTPFAKTTGNLVKWMNEERRRSGLDAVFLNGDIVHDSTTSYEALKRDYLKTLTMPYYAIKGNHDFVDGKAGSPNESWKTIWGYPSNHVVRAGKRAFILADTSKPKDSRAYMAADIAWLKKQLAALAGAETIFVIMHIAQRKHGVQNWPKHGVKDPRQMPLGEAVMKLLESHKTVRAIFHGHSHDETSRYVSGGKPYFFDSHVGGTFGNRKGYRIVEIRTGEKIVTYQYDAENARVMNRHTV